MTNEYKLREAIHLVWYNLPNGVSTFSVCQTEGCDESARGGGKCLKCAEKELAAMVGEVYAASYVQHVKYVRRLEGDMLEVVND